MAHGKFKDFPRRTDFDKLLCDQVFNIAKNPKYERYQTGFAVVAYKILDKVW